MSDKNMILGKMDLSRKKRLKRCVLTTSGKQEQRKPN